jgi:prephenate dehydratase
MSTDTPYPYALATLGPTGTCSHQVGVRYLRKHGLPETSIILTQSFEEAVELVKDGRAERLLIPSAYRKHADIVFDNASDIVAIDAFPSPTPDFFFLRNPKKAIGEIRRIASHASPRRLIDKVSGLARQDVEIIEASSNANAAELLEAGEVDGCLTVKSDRTIALLNAGKAVLLCPLGVIMMTWSVMTNISMANNQYPVITSPVY